MARVLLLGEDGVTAQDWRGRRLRAQRHFASDTAAMASLQEWLLAQRRRPVRILVDLLDEEHHVVPVPRLYGADRRALCHRLAERHLGATPYRDVVLRRPPRGRRGAVEALVGGVTAPDALDAWLGMLTATGVPLRGIHSLARVGEHLLACLGLAHGAVLLVSRQRAGGWRHAFYIDGHLRFSRLVLGGDAAPVAAVGGIREEARRTLDYLAAQGAWPANEAVTVVLLGGEAGASDDDSPPVPGAGPVRFHPLATDAAARRLGLRGPIAAAGTGALYGYALAARWRPGGDYGRLALRRHERVWRLRQTAYGMAGLCLAGASGLAVSAAVTVAAHTAAAEEARGQAATMTQRHEARLEAVTTHDHDAGTIERAVDRLDTLAPAAARNPEAAMARVGDLLGEHPGIALRRLEWTASNPDPGVETRETADPAAEPSAAGVRLRLAGEVTAGDGDYRAGRAAFDAFRSDLATHVADGGVEIERPPFELDSSGRVAGGTALPEGTSGGMRQFAVAFDLQGGAPR